MSKLTAKAIAITCLLATGPAVADTDFAAGSLIIPASATYQTDCGAVSMYGLVYTILRANTWLEANRATACPGFPSSVSCAIEVHYAYKTDKKSPNRCTPTDKHVGPSYSGSGTITHAHAKWNDGCDFQIGADGLTVPPVKAITHSTATNVSTDSTAVVLSTTSGTARYPEWGAKNITHTATAEPNTTDIDIVRYYGGSFVIDDADAITLRKLIQGTLVAKDVVGNAIAFTNFKTNSPSGPSCSYGTTIGGTVTIHSAQTAFTAPTPKVFTAPPPRLALLARNANASPSAGGSSSSPGSNSKTGRVDDGILQKYLERAGLSFTGANGCPTGGYHAANSTLCPTGGNPGQIYDTFDMIDLVNGRLKASDYKMFWAPHWEFKSTQADTNAAATTDEANAIKVISQFLDGQTGLMAECASIETFEGQYWSNSNATQAVPAGQLMSCVGSGTTCNGTSTSFGFRKNVGGTANDSSPTGALNNCTDPTVTSGSSCAFFSEPGDPFAQTADYRFVMDGTSRVASFLNNTSSIYRPGVKPLVSGVSSLNTTNRDLLVANPSNATARAAMIRGDYVARYSKDNNPAKANILYLGGHDMSSYVAGTKIALQTLLQLGDPPVVETTTEVARANPIIYPINGVTAMVQGTWEKKTGGASATTVGGDGDVEGFRFPYHKGHMRAIDVSKITTTAKDLTELTPIFDAADKIPTPTFSGCGASAFSGTCRTVFTNTSGGFNPTRVMFQQSNASGIGAAMTTGISVTATNQQILMQRVLAGENTSGTFEPALGGVDRSTVAIIPTSLVAGSARPTVVYFGGRDGMLHAVCGSVLPGSACSDASSLGREIWAFIPRTQLGKLRLNQARIEGSPRVVELLGDFTGSGTSSFRTILLFQTGSGTPSVPADAPAVYALDITNPQDPKILWEFTTANASATSDLGIGLNITAGRVIVGGKTTLLAFAQTANGGAGGAGSVVTAIDIETGQQVWRTVDSINIYPNPARGVSGEAVPTGALPGGAIAIDRYGTGYISDVMFGTIYGDIWQLDAATGANRHGSNPLFRFTQNKKPFGSPLTLMGSGGGLYAVGVSGGYVDLAASILWSGTQHQAVALSLGTPATSAPLNESSPPGSDLKWVFNLDAGDRSFSQAQVINGQLFIVGDNTDVNSEGFGGTPDSGELYRLNTDTGAEATASVVLSGGGGAVASSGSTIYAAGGTQAQQIVGDATGTGVVVNNTTPATVARKLWLRTL
jgi:hypothetical protein